MTSLKSSEADVSTNGHPNSSASCCPVSTNKNSHLDAEDGFALFYFFFI